MLVKNVRTMAACLVAGVIVLFGMPSSGFGGTDFEKLLDNKDKGDLKKIVKATEKIIDKNKKDEDAIKTLGFAYHNLALEEEKGAAKKSVKYLRRLNKIMPDDAIVLGYLGSAITLEGRDTINIIKKMGGVNKGTPMIDKAIAMSPDSVHLRILRANNSENLPPNFKREKFVKIDFLHLEEIIKKSPEKVSTDLKGEVYFKLGMIMQKEGNDKEAKDYFIKATEASPKSQWGKKAKKQL